MEDNRQNDLKSDISHLDDHRKKLCNLLQRVERMQESLNALSLRVTNLNEHIGEERENLQLEEGPKILEIIEEEKEVETIADATSKEI